MSVVNFSLSGTITLFTFHSRDEAGSTLLSLVYIGGRVLVVYWSFWYLCYRKVLLLVVRYFLAFGFSTRNRTGSKERSLTKVRCRVPPHWSVSNHLRTQFLYLYLNLSSLWSHSSQNVPSCGLVTFSTCLPLVTT